MNYLKLKIPSYLVHQTDSISSIQLVLWDSLRWNQIIAQVSCESGIKVQSLMLRYVVRSSG